MSPRWGQRKSFSSLLVDRAGRATGTCLAHDHHGRTQQSAAQGITLLEDLDDRVGLDAVALFHGHCLVQFGIEGLAMGVYRHDLMARQLDRKSKRLNSSHVKSSYAVYCLKNNTI